MKAFQLQPSLIKNSAKDYLNWKVTRHMLLFTLIFVLLSLISAWYYTPGPGVVIMDILQLICFLVLGVVHFRLLETGTAFIHFSSKEKFYLTIVLSLAIYGSLLLVYFIINSEQQRIALAGSSAFLLPFIIIKAWDYFQLIPAKSSFVWKDYHLTNENQGLVFLNTIPINFRLSGMHHHKEETVYLISTPVNLELGKAFNSFLNRESSNGNPGIECTDKDNKPFAWQFYHLRFGGLYKQPLDPGKTLYNNEQIKKYSTIIAKRIELTEVH